MRFALVTEGMPGPATAGGAMSIWALMNALVKQGHTVSCLVVVAPPSREPNEMLESSMKAIRALGVTLHTLVHPPAPTDFSYGEKWRRFLFPRYDDFYPSRTLTGEMTAILEREKPDAIYVFDYGPLLALQDYRAFPKIASLGDPVYLVWKNRLRVLPTNWSKSFFWNRIGSARANARMPGQLVNILKKYDACLWFAAQHNRWLNAQGVPCSHIHVPVTGYPGGDSAARRAARPAGKPKIVMLGHLTGTANLLGLYPFLRTTVPLLEKKFGADGFEVAIIGRDKPPADLVADLNRPSIRLKGFVRDLDEEFFAADVMVAPAPYDVGIRTRVLLSLSYGICIVADRTTQLGIPELESEKNCLLADGPANLADALERALRDRDLNARLGRGARETFEKYFTPETAGLEIGRHLEALANRRRA